MPRTALKSGQIEHRTRTLIEKFRFHIWAPWRVDRFNSYYLSHSQFGEDMVLRYLMAHRQNGFYVDLGAHHPVFLSNTYHFYRRGWRGLCVDAVEHTIELFRALRPRDISVTACLSTSEGEAACFYLFEEAALNTLDETAANEIILSGRSRLLEKRTVQTCTLASLLQTYLPTGVEVDLLTIDIEGIDEALILGHDWRAFHPRAIVFEAQRVEWQQISTLPCVIHLQSFGYKVEAKCGHSIIMTG